ncbi:MAG: alcohol dehydrogenase catalytic domain-containing protein [Erysipelothrix sp.]|nr:alcohol dehydrogenase catalytic domain-containing protein [Erysipelothrix sp.]
MKIAVFDKVRSVKIETITKPEVTDETVLVKVLASAICTWEQRVYSGVKEVEFPFVGGHEISGEIVDVGKNIDLKKFKLGQKVVVGTFLSCYECDACKRGDHQVCEYLDHSRKLEGTDFIGMGGFSEYLVVHPKHLFKYESMKDEIACLIEPVSCCIHSIEKSGIQFGDTVLIIGCGIMGLLHAQLALKKGAVVYACDSNRTRLELAKKFGVKEIINIAHEDLESKVSKLTNKGMIDHLFNTTATSETVPSFMKLLSVGGKQTMYSSFYPDKLTEVSPDSIHKKEQNLLGTSNSNSRDFMRAIRMVENGIIDLSPFVSELIEFDDIKEALEKSVTEENYRVVLKVSE